MKPREFYIEFDGDPLDDEKVCKRYVSTEKFSPMFPDQEVVYTREVLPNEVVLDRAVVEALVRALEDIAKALVIHHKESNDAPSLYSAIYSTANEALAAYHKATERK